MQRTENEKGEITQQQSFATSTILLQLRGGVRSARPRTQHDCHHDTKVKLEAATAVIELLMMGGKTPETCWAVNKRKDNKLENCCIWLVIYLNWKGKTCHSGIWHPTVWCMWITSVKTLSFYTMTLSVRLTNWPNKYRIPKTKWVKVVLTVMTERQQPSSFKMV